MEWSRSFLLQADPWPTQAADQQASELTCLSWQQRNHQCYIKVLLKDPKRIYLWNGFGGKRIGTDHWDWGRIATVNGILAKLKNGLGTNVPSLKKTVTKTHSGAKTMSFFVLLQPQGRRFCSVDEELYDWHSTTLFYIENRQKYCLYTGGTP